MLLSLTWLREFVPYTGSAEELGHTLTMLGLELEEIRRPYDALNPLVVGHVIECAQHPEADKLAVCKVDAGQGALLDIVCGAPNVALGQKVAVALVGAVMPDGMIIKKAKLRGAPSHGMLCSERELGLTEDHSGIMVLDTNAPVGARLVDVLALDREVLDVSVTPNRADCLSILGLAREVALAFGLPLTIPTLPLAEHSPDMSTDASTDITIHIDDPELCWLYQGRIIENVRIGPSPMRIRHRLHAHGMRPINNVVDATNYILHELGQPLHAFDRAKIRGNRIHVQTACDGERFTTLDGQERSLSAGDVCICDGMGSVALAGVMGGLESEITQTSTSVFLESAVFRPGSIRKTGRRLGLSSASSYRFERGVDQVGNTFAMNKAAAMIAQVSGGQVRRGVCRNEARPWRIPTMPLRLQRATMLLGVDMNADWSAKTLRALGCVVDDSRADVWHVSAPSWRCDLEREADLIEELGRVYGLDRIAPVLPPVQRSLADASATESTYAFWARLKRWASGLGLNEAVNYSFVGHKDLDQLDLPLEGRLSILNPLSAEQDALRTALAPGLLHNLRHNIAQGNTGLRLFELAHIFSADPDSKTTAREEGRLGLLFYGDRVDAAWPHTHAHADYHDIKAVLEHLCAFLHLPAPRCVAVDAHPYLGPCADVRVHDCRVGTVGRLVPAIADTCYARKDVWLAEINLDALHSLHTAAHVRFAPLPGFPPVRRDITVVASSAVTVDAVLDHVYALQRPLLKSIRMIDIFEQEGAEERHLTFRLTFRAQRTLLDAEVDKERLLVAQSLCDRLGVRIG